MYSGHMESVVAVANEIILAEAAQGRELDHIRLQKLVYYVQVYSLLAGEQAYSEELQAWEKGPMVPYLRNFMLSLPNRPLVYSLKAPLDGRRVRSAVISAAIALVTHLHGPLSTNQIVDESHNSMLYHNAGRNEVINVENVRRAYAQLGPDGRAIPTPIHRQASEAEQEIIQSLNSSLEREDLLDDLSEVNYPLLMSLAVTHRDMLTERAMADVIRGIALSWWEAPRDAVNMLLVGLASSSLLVQERSVRGLASILNSDWDEEVRAEPGELDAIKTEIRNMLVSTRDQTDNPVLAPYLHTTYRSLLTHA